MADLYDLGDKPPLGDVPSRMHAYVVRQNRFGPPREAWKREVIPTPISYTSFNLQALSTN